MTEIEKINQWKTPKWHPDFGDPSQELNLLKTLCFKIIELGYDFNFELDCFEEGYICVYGLKNNKLFFEFQVVNPDKNIIGIFLENGDENYFSELNEIKRFLE